MKSIKRNRIEITTVIGCKLNCHYCPQKLLTSKYYEENKNRLNCISVELFKEYLSKIEKDTIICFAGMSEPWLNRECTEMILYAHSKGYTLEVYTTLLGMTIDDFERIKNIDFNEFVIHLPDRQKNTIIPITDEYLELLKTITNYSLVDRKFVSGYSCHGDIHPDIYNLFSEDDLKIVNYELNNRANNISSDIICNSSTVTKLPFRCIRTGKKLNHNVLLPDGTIILCCMDYQLKHQIGNLNYANYNEILNSNELEKVRNAMDNDNENSILCKNCVNAKNIDDLYEQYCDYYEWAFIMFNSYDNNQ